MRGFRFVAQGSGRQALSGCRVPQFVGVAVMAGYSGAGVFGVEDCVGDQLCDVVVFQAVVDRCAVAAGVDPAGETRGTRARCRWRRRTRSSRAGTSRTRRPSSPSAARTSSAPARPTTGGSASGRRGTDDARWLLPVVCGARPRPAPARVRQRCAGRSCPPSRPDRHAAARGEPPAGGPGGLLWAAARPEAVGGRRVQSGARQPPPRPLGRAARRRQRRAAQLAQLHHPDAARRLLRQPHGADALGGGARDRERRAWRWSRCGAAST